MMERRHTAGCGLLVCLLLAGCTSPAPVHPDWEALWPTSHECDRELYGLVVDCSRKEDIQLLEALPPGWACRGQTGIDGWAVFAFARNNQIGLYIRESRGTFDAVGWAVVEQNGRESVVHFSGGPSGFYRLPGISDDDFRVAHDVYQLDRTWTPRDLIQGSTVHRVQLEETPWVTIEYYAEAGSVFVHPMQPGRDGNRYFIQSGDITIRSDIGQVSYEARHWMGTSQWHYEPPQDSLLGNDDPCPSW